MNRAQNQVISATVLLNELSFNQKQEFSPSERRTSKYFNDLKKIQNNIFFNKNLFKLEEDKSKSDEIDYEKSLRKIASNVMLKISSLLELVHTNNGGEPSEYRLGVAHISMLKALEIRNFSF